ncbi:hypothetical protein BDV96DRAFT_85333 [Lophiotrema nucula]|uniref:Uncharacterized protein n=1 Tax=Lophiotrema nucula TaxID=690887 RepID=A0A6A5Z5S2_9PLEO|nr:hypothetical protein BDV96DRAFT_85333 [Lophiotrema nucula]
MLPPCHSGPAYDTLPTLRVPGAGELTVHTYHPKPTPSRLVLARGATRAIAPTAAQAPSWRMSVILSIFALQYWRHSEAAAAASRELSLRNRHTAAEMIRTIIGTRSTMRRPARGPQQVLVATVTVMKMPVSTPLTWALSVCTSLWWPSITPPAHQRA